jgi:MFS family permease
VNPEAARADRNASIRAAARSWRKAGAIDAAALVAVEAAYPDDRHRVGPVFRVLLFVFALIAINGGLGFVWALAGSDSEPVLAGACLVLGLLLIGATELQIHSMRRSQSGVEAATSFAGLGFLTGFAFWAFYNSGVEERWAVGCTLLAAALLLAGAAWRWGYPFYAGVAMAALLGSFVVLPGGRPVWIALPLALAPFLIRGSESDRLPPALRSSCTAALGVGLAGLYVAVNYASYDQAWLEAWKGNRPAGPGSDAWRALFWMTTAMVPIVYFAIGLRTRRHVFLVLGALTAAVSAVTLRAYVHLAPLWAILTLSGAALVGAVFALRRHLDAGPGKERGGFTAEPLFEDLARRRMLEAGAAVLSLSPEARPVHQEPKFEGEGGSFGGGGSNSEF